MKRSALCLAILCALSHPSAWAETKELWAYGVSKNGGWYDTTKVNPTGSVEDPKPDSQMCWAATAANMISWWQHWDENNSALAPQGALNIYDRIKADYGQNLADNGAVLGLEWWFNGSCREYLSSQYILNNNADVFKNTSFGGFYSSLRWNYSKNLKSETSSLLYSVVYTSLVSSFSLSQAVGLGIFPTSGFGHSITLWGIEYDSDTQTISKLYVTDSDDYGTGLFALDCSKGNDGLMYLSSDEHATYKTGQYHVDNLVTLGLVSSLSEETKGQDPNAGFFSNTYFMDPLSLAGNTTGTAPTQTKSSEGLGDVTFSKDVSYSTSDAVSLYAKAEGEYLKIGNVTVESGVNLSLTNASIEAAGNVEADTATLSLDSATFSGAKVTLNAGTVEMKSGVVESTNERGSATGTTFKGTGAIKNMTITGGSLISGNSPGLMELSGDQLATVELSFYLGAGTNQEMGEAGRTSKIVLDTTLASGVLEGTVTKVSSGFLLTQGTTLSGDITLSVWNDGALFSVYSGEAVYFSEGSYIQVIAFGEGVSYRDVLGVNFKLDSSISDKGNMSLMAVSDSTGNAYWQKQVRTDGVYLVLSASTVYDVPEPTTGVLVLTGLGLLLRRRRRA
ncbi:MAG: PEP-CTERM sorting domain-containing protein [Akkermansia muciniphila]